MKRAATLRFRAMRHRVVEGDVDGAKVYRLQAVSGDRTSAEATVPFDPQCGRGLLHR